MRQALGESPEEADGSSFRSKRNMKHGAASQTIWLTLRHQELTLAQNTASHLWTAFITQVKMRLDTLRWTEGERGRLNPNGLKSWDAVPFSSSVPIRNTAFAGSCRSAHGIRESVHEYLIKVVAHLASSLSADWWSMPAACRRGEAPVILSESVRSNRKHGSSSVL